MSAKSCQVCGAIVKPSEETCPYCGSSRVEWDDREEEFGESDGPNYGEGEE